MRVFIKLLYICVVFFGFVVPAVAQNDVVQLCEPFPPPDGRPLSVCPGGISLPGCADREPATQEEKDEHAFFSVHPELFPDIYKTGTHLNIIAAYNKSGCNLETFGKDFPELTPAGFFEDLKTQPATPTPPSEPPPGLTPVIGGGGDCLSARGREKDPLHNPDNPGSTAIRPKLVPEQCGATFETYNPPAIACGEKGGIPGVWAIVSRNGDVNGQSIGSCLNNAPGGYVHDCSLQNQCATYTPNTNIQYVFVKPEDPQPSTENLVQSSIGDRYLGDSGEIEKIRLNHFTSLNVNKFNFQTGFFSNDQGETFSDGIPVDVSGSSSGTKPPMRPVTSNLASQPGLLVTEATRQAAEQQVARVQASLQSTIAKRQAAEQQFNNARDTLTTATAAQATAEQQLATAQATLASATEALQAAEQTLQQQAAEQATMEEQLATAQAELASAEAAQRTARQAEKQALEDQAKRRSEEQAARAEQAAKEAAEQAAKLAAELAEQKARDLRISEAKLAEEQAAKEKAEMLAQIAAAEEVRRVAEEAARQAAEQAAQEVAEQAAAQAEEQAAQQKAALSAAQTASSDARAIRQAAEQALQQLQAQAASGDPAAQIAAAEAREKAEEAKLAFTQAAEAANLAAEQAAKEAAEKAAQLATDLAAAKAAEAQAIAIEEAAAALARQAEDHAVQIQQTWRF